MSSMNLLEITRYAVIAIALASLAYGSYSDLRTRTVSSLLFVPLMAAGIIINVESGSITFFVLAGALMMVLAFLKADTGAYIFAGTVFLIISIVMMEISGFYYGFELLIMSLVYLMGFNEMLFGAGDIKAIVSLMYAFSQAFTLVQVRPDIIYGIVPPALIMLVGISIFSLVWAIYGIILTGGSRKSGTGLFRMKYDAALAQRKPQAFSLGERGDISYMTYRVPFMLPIFLGFLAYLMIIAIL
ncbi:MAG: hypothetical protein QXN26_01050 [Thermoplasmataceae archaeon]